MQREQPRIGVYICHCGGNISNSVDVNRVKDNISKLENVIVAETNEYVCSNPGQENIRNDIKKYNLN
ncbi:MAG: disulfide reductase, partial [Promethearchaeota archaeon]